MDSGKIITNDVDILGTIKFIIRTNKKYQAVFLDSLENILINKPELYEQIRKLYLDSSNNFARSVLKTLFDDIEYLVK